LREQSTEVEQNYWKIISDLKKESIASTIVFSQSKIKHFNGLRATIPTEVTWISIPAESTQFLLEAVQKENQFLVRKGYTTSSKVYLETQKMSSLPDSIIATPQRKLTITIVRDEGYTQDLQIIKAALKAVQQTIPVEFSISEITSAQSFASADWIIWLSDSTVPDFDSLNSLTLTLQNSNELISQQKLNQWTINKRLTIEVARKENLSLQLADLLLSDSALTNKLTHYDNRTLPDSILASGTRKLTTTMNASLLPHAPNRYLIFFFLLVLLTERIIAYARKQ
jgi:hypothetical protein